MDEKKHRTAKRIVKSTVRRKQIASKALGIALACLMIGTVFGTLPSTARAAGNFNIGDTVEVQNTGSIGLKVRDSPAGNQIGGEYDGSLGVTLEGPQTAAIGGIVYTWWKVRYEDGLEGWSAEGDPGGVDYLKWKYIPPSTKFNLNDPVKVYNTGTLGLIVRTNPPELAYVTKVYDDTEGTVIDGPFYGVPKGGTGFYYFWRVNYGGVIGWSAQDWLKVAPTKYDLTISASGQGTTNPDPGTHSYSQGTSVTITATPASGWRFDHWGGDASGTNSSVTITMNSNKSIVAYFVPNQPPTCSISANQRYGKVPLTVTFTMSANDPDGSISAWVLDVDGDGNADYQGYGNPPPTKTHTYTSEGEYRVMLVVFDDEGETAFDTETVNVGPNPPPTCSLSADKTLGEAPLTVTFTMSASDDGWISTWVLDVGDGNSYSGDGSPPPTQPHTYTDSGTYNAILMVSDDGGATDSDACTINVKPPQPDLIVEKIQVDPDPPSLGGSTTVGIRIKNQGKADATRTFFLEFYFDTTYKGHVYVDDLPAGSTKTSYWRAMTWPSDTNLHTIRGVVDPDDTVPESNEYNNELSKEFRATSLAIYPPTAYIDSISPETATQGVDTVSFTGHGTDPDGHVVAYEWRSSIDGQLSTSSSFSRPASELSPRTHTIYFKVKDDDGLWSAEVTDTLIIIQSEALQTGTIEVTSYPSGAPFNLSGPATYSDTTPWSISDAPVGSYTITWGTMSGYDAPLLETQTLVEGSTISFYGPYEIREVLVRIDSYSANPDELIVGETSTLELNLTNTGNIAWTFYAAVSLRKPDGDLVHLPLKPLALDLSQQGSAEWSYTVDMEGGWDVVFGVWKESTQETSLGPTGWLDDYITAFLPTSSVNPIEPYWRPVVPFTITAEARGGVGGIQQVELYYKFSEDDRFSEDDQTWFRYGADGDGSDGWSWEFDAPKGGGYYEFCSIAVDAEYNREDKERGGSGWWKPEASAFVSTLGWALSLDEHPTVEIANLTRDERNELYHVVNQVLRVNQIKEENPVFFLETSLLLDEFKNCTQPIDLVREEAISPTVDFWLVTVGGEIASQLTAFLTGGVPLPPGTGEVFKEAGFRIGELLELSNLGYARVISSVGELEIAYHRNEREVWVSYYLPSYNKVVAIVIPVKSWAEEISWDFTNYMSTVPFSVSEIGWLEPQIEDVMIVGLDSPGELRVYDSQERFTGLVGWEVREEIPNSMYDQKSSTVIILHPSDSYTYEIAGTDEGTYGLTVRSVENEEINTLNLTNVPTSTGAVHQYTVDWDVLALSRGENGVTMVENGGETPTPPVWIIMPDLVIVESPQDLPEFVRIAEKFEVRLMNVMLETPFELRIENSKFTRIWIDLKEARENVKTTIEKLEGKPLGLPDPLGLVWAYHRIEVNVPEDAIENAEIDFWVPKEWLTTHGVSKENVRLLRFGEGWEELTTEIVGENATHVSYRAGTPGFSVFAITAYAPPAEVLPLEINMMLVAALVAVGMAIALIAALARHRMRGGKRPKRANKVAGLHQKRHLSSNPKHTEEVSEFL